MKIAYFTHSLESCWNHGNAHFLRGVLSELIARGHEVHAFEPADSWSRANLIADHGPRGLNAYRAAYPELSSIRFDELDQIEPLLSGADLVIVHEWNAPGLVKRLGALRRRGASFALLFHDTHHRAVSEPDAMRAYDLGAYDGVLAFGEALAEMYRRWGWGDRVWVWHEAADLRRFTPPVQPQPREGLVWIGNWGDDERAEELEEFLFRPAAANRLPLDIYGVRYPEKALATLRRHGAHHHGWAPNAAAPEIFARHLATVHVPRRHYTHQLPGIPTIRMFEALACGIPLVSAPWDDCEGLFRAGTDYLRAHDGAEMTALLHDLVHDPALRRSLAAHGIETIHARHSCAHRVDQLLAIVSGLGAHRQGNRAA